VVWRGMVSPGRYAAAACYMVRPGPEGASEHFSKGSRTPDGQTRGVDEWIIKSVLSSWLTPEHERKRRTKGSICRERWRRSGRQNQTAHTATHKSDTTIKVGTVEAGALSRRTVSPEQSQSG